MAASENLPDSHLVYPPREVRPRDSQSGQKRHVKLICTVVIIGLVLWVGIHGAVRAREHARRFVCAKQIRGIAATMQIYVNNGWDGKSPFMEWFLANNPDSRRWLICPGSTPAQSNYVVNPMPNGWPKDSQAVIIYEPKSNHGGEGGYVYLADHRLLFARGLEYDELIRALEWRAPLSP